jgi:hypothetical protein
MSFTVLVGQQRNLLGYEAYQEYQHSGDKQQGRHIGEPM